MKLLYGYSMIFNRIALPALAFIGFLLSPTTGEADQHVTVVELFTSEGCSTCPAADKYLGELANRDDLIALAYHVDYWDYIGWKDPFADPKFTERQKSYARFMSKRTIYTPQMVMQGIIDAPGTRPGKVERAIKSAQSLPRLTLDIEHTSDGSVTLNIGSGDFSKSDILLARYDKEQQTNVTRGENAGHTLSHFNVVDDLTYLGEWDGAAVKINVPTQTSKQQSLAVMIQAQSDGQILAAVKLGL